MEKIVVINEKKYQEFKCEISKKNDYFTKKELQDLMQFLMQRQEKVIKNEEKIQKIIF
jgi:lauroyl/myristoyl acyltransferase